MFVVRRCSFLFFSIAIVLNQLEWSCAHQVNHEGKYCNIASCGHKGPHTMCLHTSSTPAKACGKYTKVPLSKNEITTIVNQHNLMRQEVAMGMETLGHPGPQPAAKTMPLLKWDPELARIAQRYADQCVKGHDKCRDVARFRVGQNIATTWGHDSAVHPSLMQHIRGWYDEVALFNRSYVHKYVHHASWGHYTQMLWGKTKFIGCGRVRFTVRRKTTLRLICNYGPSGNRIGQPVYEAVSNTRG